jgi:two-component system response regulator GlrR
LRARPDDLPALVRAMLTAMAATPEELAALTGPDVMARLAANAWPGNVRELRNYLEACVVRQERAAAALVPASEPTIDITQPLRAVRDRWVRHVERRYLEALLRAHGNNVSAAARAAGLDRVHLHRLLKASGLR